MAKIKYTAVVADMRGKLNGNVMSKNKYGSYVRNKVTPSNPQTGFQADARQNLASHASGWRNLTQAERDAWISAAPNFPQTNVFGDQQTLTGSALYVRLNTNLVNVGSSVISVPPTPSTIGAIAVTGITADVSSTTLEVVVAGTGGTGNETLQVWATPCVSPGKSFVKNLYRYLGNFDNDGNPLDIYALWNDRFGSLVAGQKLFVQVVVCNTVTGEQGVGVNSYTIVVP